MHGTIVILNGTSSSGKSTTAKALQNALPGAPYLHAGIDNFIFMLPKAWINPPLWSQVFEYDYDDAGNITRIRAGQMGHQLIGAMHNAVAGLARRGFNVIVDHVLLEPAWLEDCLTAFDGLNTYLIGVKCPLEVVEQRERDRKDRTLGQARAQYDVVHADKIYDLEVDTSQGDAAWCAQQIAAFITSGHAPVAFQQHTARKQVQARSTTLNRGVQHEVRRKSLPKSSPPRPPLPHTNNFNQHNVRRGRR